MGFLGNRCTFDGGVVQWSTSPAHVCDVIVAVPTRHDTQAVNKKGEFDDDDVTEHDMSGHDEAHTAKLVEVVMPVLMSFVDTHCFVFQCASGWCDGGVYCEGDARCGHFRFQIDSPAR